MKTHRTRRRRYYLQHTSQPQMLFGVQLLLGLVALVSTTLLYLNANKELTESYWAAHLTIKNVQQLLLPRLVVVNLMGFVLSLVLLIFYTHRIAGPAYNLKQVLRKVAQGDLSATIRFRKGDYLHDIADEGNLALDHFRREICVMKQLTEKLLHHWDQCDKSGLQPELRDEMGVVVNELQHRLSKFRLEKDDQPLSGDDGKLSG